MALVRKKLAKSGNKFIRVAVKEELFKVLNIEPVKDINQGVLRQILEGLLNLPKEDWEKLTYWSKWWTNRAVDAVNSAMPIPDLPDRFGKLRIATESSHGATADDFYDLMGLPTKGRDEGPAFGPKAKKYNQETKNKTASRRAKEILLNKGLDMPTRQIHVALLEEGYEISLSTLNMVCSEFRQSVRLLKARGWLVTSPKGLIPKVKT